MFRVFEKKQKDKEINFRRVLGESAKMTIGSITLISLMGVSSLIIWLMSLLQNAKNLESIYMIVNLMSLFIVNVIYIVVIVVINAKYNSKQLSRSEIWNNVKGSYWKVFGIDIIQILLIIVVSIPSILIYNFVENTFVRYFIAAIFCIPGIVIFSKFFFASTIAIVEQKNVKAIRNSFLITKDYFQLTFLCALSYALFLGVSFVFQNSILQTLEPFSSGMKIVAYIIRYIVFGIFALLFFRCLTVIFYNKIRPGSFVRK